MACRGANHIDGDLVDDSGAAAYRYRFDALSRTAADEHHDRAGCGKGNIIRPFSS